MIFVHLCTSCTHPQRDHVHDRYKLRAVPISPWCDCCRDNPSPPFDPEPVARETYLPGGGVEDVLYEPGTERNSGGAHRERLCGCERCHELAAQAVAF